MTLDDIRSLGRDIVTQTARTPVKARNVLSKKEIQRNRETLGAFFDVLDDIRHVPKAKERLETAILRACADGRAVANDVAGATRVNLSRLEGPVCFKPGRRERVFWSAFQWTERSDSLQLIVKDDSDRPPTPITRDRTESLETLTRPEDLDRFMIFMLEELKRVTAPLRR